MVARTVVSGEQHTGEHHAPTDEKRRFSAPPAPSLSSAGLFHTVTASTPRAKRLARVYPHSNATQRWPPPPQPQPQPQQQQQQQQEQGAGGAEDGGATLTTLRRSSTGSRRFYPGRCSRSAVATRCGRDPREDESESDEESELLLSLAPTRVVRGSSTSSLNFQDELQQYGEEIDWSDSCAPTIQGLSAAATATGSRVQEDILTRIATLQALCDQGFISSDEYERRKCAIVDELTFPYSGGDGEDNGECDTDYGDDQSAAGTEFLATQLTVTQPSRSPLSRAAHGLPLIVPHGPNFSDIRPETATKHVFDYASRQWSSTQVRVALDETPFSKGSLRVVYHLLDLSEEDASEDADTNQQQQLRRRKRRSNYVAKLAIDPDEDPQTYFRDAELQAHCAHYAQLYNSYKPPKRVDFIEAWVLELTERCAPCLDCAEGWLIQVKTE